MTVTKDHPGAGAQDGLPGLLAGVGFAEGEFAKRTGQDRAQVAAELGIGIHDEDTLMDHNF
jgi:hypothetical protein